MQVWLAGPKTSSQPLTGYSQGGGIIWADWGRDLLSSLHGCLQDAAFVGCWPAPQSLVQ